MDISFDLSRKYALAVSGGVDSVVLLDLFCKKLPEADFFVVTINHNLRAEAQADCDFVVALCRQHGVECIEKSVDVLRYAEENKVSEETAGRLLRRQVFASLDCDRVVTAHHKNDNAEVVLMHILRGSGVSGAAAMKKDDGRFFRPLLDFDKDEIIAYAKENNLSWREDCTNAQNVYARNFVRNKILPETERVYPSAVENLCRFATNCQRDDDFISSFVQLDKVEFTQNSAKIPKTLLLAPQPVAARLLLKVFASLGATYDIENKHISSVLALAEKESGKKVCLPFDLTAFNDYNYVTVCREKHSDGFCFPFGKAENKKIGNVVCRRGKEGLYFDGDKLPDGCVLRTRRKQDVFNQFGGVKKKLKEWFIDKKIPARFRDSIPLLAKDDVVYVVVGYAISEDLRVDDKTQNVFNVFTEEKNG